jgi:hypothetical protein
VQTNDELAAEVLASVGRRYNPAVMLAVLDGLTRIRCGFGGVFDGLEILWWVQQTRPCASISNVGLCFAALQSCKVIEVMGPRQVVLIPSADWVFIPQPKLGLAMPLSIDEKIA